MFSNLEKNYRIIKLVAMRPIMLSSYQSVRRSTVKETTPSPAFFGICVWLSLKMIGKDYGACKKNILPWGSKMTQDLETNEHKEHVVKELKRIQACKQPSFVVLIFGKLLYAFVEEW